MVMQPGLYVHAWCFQGIWQSRFCKIVWIIYEAWYSGICLRIIMDLYTGETLKTVWCGTISWPLSVSNCVRQGPVLSPIMFNVYFDELLQRLQDHVIASHVGTKLVGAVGYVDDLTLLSALRGLKKALDICHDFAQEYSVKSNSIKAQCMCIGKDGE